MEYTYRRAKELCPGGFTPIDADRSSSDFYVATGNTVQNMPKSSASLVVQCSPYQAVAPQPPPPMAAPPSPPPSGLQYCFRRHPRSGGKIVSNCFPTADACQTSRRSVGQLSVVDSDCEALTTPVVPTRISGAPESSSAPPDPRFFVEHGIKVFLVDHRFYCFNATETIRLCMADMNRCMSYRDGLGASAQPCTPEDGVACFRIQAVTTGKVDAMCFSLMEHCRTGRSVFTNADNVPLDDECFVMRYRP